MTNTRKFLIALGILAVIVLIYKCNDWFGSKKGTTTKTSSVTGTSTILREGGVVVGVTPGIRTNPRFVVPQHPYNPTYLYSCVGGSGQPQLGLSGSCGPKDANGNYINNPCSGGASCVPM